VSCRPQSGAWGVVVVSEGFLEVNLILLAKARQAVHEAFGRHSMMKMDDDLWAMISMDHFVLINIRCLLMVVGQVPGSESPVFLFQSVNTEM